MDFLATTFIFNLLFGFFISSSLASSFTLSWGSWLMLEETKLLAIPLFICCKMIPGEGIADRLAGDIWKDSSSDELKFSLKYSSSVTGYKSLMNFVSQGLFHRVFLMSFIEHFTMITNSNKFKFCLTIALFICPESNWVTNLIDRKLGLYFCKRYSKCSMEEK